MEALIYKLFWHNWQRKLLAVLAAIVIWIFVSHSITETKMIRNVPIRIMNLPADKTVVGLLSNGILQKRINLTLSGPKDVIEEIEPGDLEVNIDASTIDHADWIVQINKKNLVSLNPDIDLANNITSIGHTEFVIKLNRFVTEKIPVEILKPQGDPPPGYKFLDVWPQHLQHLVSGPEEEVNKLKNSGLQVTFDLDSISKGDLDAIKSQQQHGQNNEIAFMIPQKWKQVAIPFRNNSLEEFNDPEAQLLRLAFLREEFLPLERQLPIMLYFPLKTLKQYSPSTLQLGESPSLLARDGLHFFVPPLYIKNVSRLFLDLVRDYLELTIAVAPTTEREILPWSVELVNARELEEMYVAYQAAQGGKQIQQLAKQREQLYRQRFRDYLQQLILYVSPEHKLNIESLIEGSNVQIISY
jgi:YbbR domain-containing protein